MYNTEIHLYTTQNIKKTSKNASSKHRIKIQNIVPIISESTKASLNWDTNLGILFIDGGHSFESANNDYLYWESKIIKGGVLIIHDIFENPSEGGQAPYEIYQKALKNNYKVYERVDTLVCLIKY